MTIRRTLTHWGAVEVTVDGDQVRQVRGHRLDPDPTDIVDPIRNRMANRVTEPMVRSSWLDHGVLARPDRRGDDALVPVEWDVALDLGSEALHRIRRERGAEAIFGGSYGWGSAGRFHHPQSQLKRFLNAGGGFVDSRGTYSHGAAEVVVPAVTGMSFADFQRTAPPGHEVAESTGLFVSFGGFPAHNTKVTSGGEVIHWFRSALRGARRRGCRFVAIGPTIGPFDRELGAQWLPIRPGTDTAVLLGLITELVRAGNHRLHELGDEGQRLVDYLLGRSDGVIRDADWAGAISGGDAGSLRRLAAELMSGTTLLNATWATQRTENGEQAVWAALALGVAVGGRRGGLEVAGGGIALGYGSMGSVGAPVVTDRLPALPQGDNPITTIIPVARIADALLQPGTLYLHQGHKAVYPDIDLIYWCGGNPFHHHQDLHRLAEAWRRPRAVLVNEPVLTATARRADIVFPSTFGFERADIGGASTGGHLVAMEQVVPPPSGARHDHEIFAALARRLGYEEAFTANRSVQDWLEFLYTRTRTCVDTLPKPGDFPAGRVAARPSADPPAPPVISLAFKTDTAASAGPIGATAHPQWIEPQEQADIGADADVGVGWLQLVTPMPASRLHAQWGQPPDEPPSARLAPIEAERRGLNEGDRAWLRNRRGACPVVVTIDDGVMPGVISVDNGYPFDPDPDGFVCRGGNVNVLTADRPSSEWAQATTAHSCLVRLVTAVIA